VPLRAGSDKVEHKAKKVRMRMILEA